MIRILFTLSTLFISTLAKDIVNNIVVFGDSYSDVSTSQKLTNGPLWSEHLAVGWKAPLYSFAFSGAVCDNDMYTEEASFIPSIVDQIEMYHKQNLNLNMNETAVIFWVGVNDIYKIFEKNDTNIQQDLNNVVECISKNIRNVRRVFSANKFIVFGVPPLERMPYYANTELASSREKAANDLNEKLTKEVEKMNKHLQNLELDLVDIHRLLDDISDQPKNFNIINTKDPYWEVCQGKCNDSIDSYVWWDKTHLTGAIHRLIANSILMAGSLAPKTYLKENTNVVKLMESFKSPIFKPVKNTGEIDRIIQKLKQIDEQKAEIEYELSANTNFIFYFTLIVSASLVGFLVLKRKSAKNQLIILTNNLLNTSKKGKFLPLHNQDSESK